MALDGGIKHHFLQDAYWTITVLSKSIGLAASYPRRTDLENMPFRKHDQYQQRFRNDLIGAFVKTALITL